MRMRMTITRIRIVLTLTICSLAFAVSAFAQDPKPTGYWAFADVTLQDKPWPNGPYPGVVTGKRGDLHSTKTHSSDGNVVWTVKTDWTWSDPPGILVQGELVTVNLGYQGSAQPPKQNDTGLGYLTAGLLRLNGGDFHGNHATEPAKSATHT